MLLDHGSVDGTQLGASLIEGGAGSETAEEFSHAMDTASDHGGGEMVRAGDHIGDDFRFLRIRDAGFEYSDDGGRDAAKTHCLADHRSIFVEIVRPEPICDNHYAGSLGTVVLRFDETAENGVQ